MDTFDEQQERERLQAENTELATLAGGLAHEIRNPLSTIGMNLELLAEELEGDESQRARRMLQRISSLQGECRNLEEILNAFLQFARAGIVLQANQKYLKQLRSMPLVDLSIRGWLHTA